jgi:dihydroorotate dehydrogenase
MSPAAGRRIRIGKIPRNPGLSLYRLTRPLLWSLPPERAHRAALWVLQQGLAASDPGAEDPALRTTLWGRYFPNPVGLAAGFDKNAEVFDAALRQLGFGFVEAGTVTPRPQAGNPQPRLFRLAADRAVINRLGFNGGGLERFTANFARRARTGVVGANIGANRDSADPAADYTAGIAALAPLADYLVVNVSSPNTPGLRALQRREALNALLGRALAARPAGGPPLLVKIAPDMTSEERADVAEVVLAAGIDGLIVGNTTVQRPAGLTDPQKSEAGGLSGRPLFPIALAALTEMRRLTGGKLPLIGCGGIASGDEAYAMIRAGASLVQLYTALVFDGPGVVGRIKSRLAARLKSDGFRQVSDAVGADTAAVRA